MVLFLSIFGEVMIWAVLRAHPYKKEFWAEHSLFLVGGDSFLIFGGYLGMWCFYELLELF